MVRSARMRVCSSVQDTDPLGRTIVLSRVHFASSWSRRALVSCRSQRGMSFPSCFEGLPLSVGASFAKSRTTLRDVLHVSPTLQNSRPGRRAYFEERALGYYSYPERYSSSAALEYRDRNCNSTSQTYSHRDDFLRISGGFEVILVMGIPQEALERERKLEIAGPEVNPWACIGGMLLHAQLFLIDGSASSSLQPCPSLLILIQSSRLVLHLLLPAPLLPRAIDSRHPRWSACDRLEHLVPAFLDAICPLRGWWLDKLISLLFGKCLFV